MFALEYDFICYKEILVIWNENLRGYDAEAFRAAVLDRTRLESRH